MTINLRNRVPDCNITDDHMGNYHTEKFFGPYDIAPHNLRKC